MMMGSTAGGSTKRRTGRRRAATRPMAEINVTPFVDVMLVLLIIFMVAAPLLTTGVPLDLPNTDGTALPTEDEEPLTVNIAADGTVYIQRTPVPLAELQPRLTAIAAERTSKQVFLRADTSLNIGTVTVVLDLLSKSGFSKVGIVTDLERRVVE